MKIYNTLAVASFVLGIAMIVVAFLYKKFAIGPYHDHASNVISASYVGEVVMISGAVIGIGGASVFSWLGRPRCPRDLNENP